MEEVRETGLDRGNVKISQLKATANCKDCGQKGHWMPDVRKPFRYDDDDVEIPHALMATRLPKPNKRVIIEDDLMSVSSMVPSEWTITDAETPIAGARTTFADGKFKGMTYAELTAKHPQNYVALRKSKSLPISQRAYVNWVDMNYDVNESTKVVVPKAGVQQHPAGNCRHVNVHHQGSSARYRRTTCKD